MGVNSAVCFRFKQECGQQWLGLLLSFEKIKKNATSDPSHTLNIPIPWAMGGKYQEITGLALDATMDKIGPQFGVRFNSSAGAMVLNSEAIKGIFEPVLTGIMNKVKRVIEKLKEKDLKYLMLVGGLASCQYLQQIVRENLSQFCSILIPCDAQLAVMKGAVHFGHNIREIVSRRLKFTYGVQINHVY